MGVSQYRSGETSYKRTSGPWRVSHSSEDVFLKTDYFRVARHSHPNRRPARAEPSLVKRYAAGLNSRISQNIDIATRADAGIVNIHTHTIRVATPQRTADSRFVVPTPIIAPVMVWVVLTGIPANAVPNRVIAPAASAQNPPTGFS